jgi:hypothetical protein
VFDHAQEGAADALGVFQKLRVLFGQLALLA